MHKVGFMPLKMICFLIKTDGVIDDKILGKDNLFPAGFKYPVSMFKF